MPSGVADFGAEAWLQIAFGVIEPADVYWIALCSSEPGPGMDGDVVSDLEPDDPSYHRVSYDTGASAWATNTGFITNISDIAFPFPSQDWGPVNHYGLLTAETGGELYAWGEFLNPQYVTVDYGMVIPAGGLVVTMTSLDNSIAV
jgi:hypothetical protein